MQVQKEYRGAVAEVEKLVEERQRWQEAWDEERQRMEADKAALAASMDVSCVSISVCCRLSVFAGSSIPTVTGCFWTSACSLGGQHLAFGSSGCHLSELNLSEVHAPVTIDRSRHDKAMVQAAKEAAAQEALELRQEVERVMTRHQERVASWEAAAAADEADLNQRRSALEVSPVTRCPLADDPRHETPVDAFPARYWFVDRMVMAVELRTWHVQAEERRVKETARKTDERDSRSSGAALPAGG